MPKFFRSLEPIIPVFHYSTIPVAAKSLSSYATNSLQKYSLGQETSGYLSREKPARGRGLCETRKRRCGRLAREGLTKILGWFNI